MPLRTSKILSSINYKKKCVRERQGIQNGIQKERTWMLEQEQRCTNLYSCTTEATPKRVILVDKSQWKNKQKIIVCEESECTRYKLITEKFMNIYNEFYYGNQQFERNRRPIEHKCRQEGE